MESKVEGQEGKEAQEALETLRIADKLNNAFMVKGADGVKKLADRLARNQFPSKTFEEFYMDLASSPLLEPQVRAILRNMANEIRRSQEHTLALMKGCESGTQIREALKRPRSSPTTEGESFAEGPLPGQDPFTEDFGDGGSRRLPIEVE